MAGTLRIEDCYLYAIASPADLARRLRSSPRELEALANAPGTYRLWYRGNRLIEEPLPRLQAIHRLVHKYLSRVRTPDHLHSTIKGRSYVTNAAAHVGSRACLKIDVQKFFQSVPRAAVYRFFVNQMRCAKDAAALLSKLVTYGDHLPTGSSSSPMLAFYCYREMFEEIVSVALAGNYTPTCYVDDISLSGRSASSRVLHQVRQIIAKYDLRSHKARIVSGRHPFIVTGVVVGREGLYLPNRRHRAIADGFDTLSAASTPKERLAALNPLISRLHEAGQIEPAFKSRARNLEHVRSSTRAALIVAA